MPDRQVAPRHCRQLSNCHESTLLKTWICFRGSVVLQSWRTTAGCCLCARAQVRVLTNREKFKVLVKKLEPLSGYNGSFLHYAGHCYVRISYVQAKDGLASNSYLSKVVGCIEMWIQHYTVKDIWFEHHNSLTLEADLSSDWVLLSYLLRIIRLFHPGRMMQHSQYLKSSSPLFV